ncbi:MAG: polyprenol monophosphomannose synthase, partial [Anaerolineaceae bacterium]|nr:polyprenol monophosphomannose synthase [Anaerolineaceae bacterium]
PTYNEAESLPKLVSALFALPLQDLNLLVVDDNSPDGTGRIADELALAYPGRLSVMHRSGKLGLCSAYLEGFKKAIADGAEAVGQMDADFSHPLEKLVELAGEIEKCDIVIGSRYVAGGRLDEHWPLWRKALSAWGNFYARTLLSLPIHDCTGGFRLYRRETLAGMPLDRIRSNGYVFQVEMAYVAYRLGYKFHEIPIYFADRRWGKSKMNIRIQAEAAVRVWQLPPAYRDLHPSSAA